MDGSLQGRRPTELLDKVSGFGAEVRSAATSAASGKAPLKDAQNKILQLCDE